MTPEEMYERGRMDGEVRERLAVHEQHFATINGQLAVVNNSLKTLTEAVTNLDVRQRSLLDTAAATRDALRTRSAQTWTVWQRIFAFLGAMATLVAMYFAIRYGAK